MLTVFHDHAWRARFGRAFLTAGALSLLTVLILALHQLYRSRIWAVRSLEISSLARSLVLCAIAAVWFNRTAHMGPRPTTIVLGAACAFVVLAGVRLGYSSWLRSRRAGGSFCQRVCILGANDEAEMLIDLLQSQPELGYRIVAVLGDPEEWAARNSDIPAIGLGSDPAKAANKQAPQTYLLLRVGSTPESWIMLSDVWFGVACMCRFRPVSPESGTSEFGPTRFPINPSSLSSHRSCRSGSWR